MRHLPRVILLAATVSGCAHPEAPPAQGPAPAGHVPTAIDLLVSHQADLELQPEQLDRIRAIGKKLDEVNAPLAQSVAKSGADRSASADGPAPAPRSRGGSGMGGGMGNHYRGHRGAMGGGKPRGGQLQTSAPYSRQQADKADGVQKEMAANHEAAVAEAFAVLDDQQQQRAAQLLDQNDYDPPSVDNVQAHVDHAANQATPRPNRSEPPDHAAR
jgi:hypothetical protein